MVKKEREVHIRKVNLSRKIALCPLCRGQSKRHSVGTRRLHNIGHTQPELIEITYSRHYCSKCKKHFSLPMDHIAQPSGRFTNRVRRTAVDLVVKQDLTLEKACKKMKEKYHVNVSGCTLHDWVIAEMKID